MIRLLVLIIYLLSLILCPCLLGQQSSPSTGEFTKDFESGDLLGWEKTGAAFDHQPTLGDNCAARGRGEPSNHQGTYWIGTFERFQGHSDQKAGDVQGDEPQGTLTSPPFTLPAGTLSFLIGGGAHLETRVELVILDNMRQEQGRACYETGKNTETMERVTWDLRLLAGRLGRIRIVDESSDGWGHINVDDLQLEGTVLMPELDGHNLTDAKAILTGFNLNLGQISKAGSQAEPDTVLEQDPAAGTEVSVGTDVNLTVAEEEMIAVPDLRGHSRYDAERILKEERLRVGDLVKRFSDQPQDSVVWQDPAAGTRVPVGTAVELWLAVSAPVEVPDIRRRHLKEAEEILEKLGLRVGQVSKRLSYQQAGTIVRQEPAPGNLASAGSAVDVWVAVTVAVKVPDLRGQSVAEATMTLGKARLRAGRQYDYYSEEKLGTVVRQSPAAGTSVSPDSAVDLFVASKEMVDVPDVRGHNRWEAEETIKAARLSVGEVSEQPANLDEDIVVGQDPAAGATVGVGAAVHLWVMAGTITTVPDLQGCSREQAQKILTAARLRLAEVLTRRSALKQGTIVAQSPAAGATVPIGTPVVLWAAASRETPVRRWSGIVAGAVIVLAGGCYLLIRFGPDHGISLSRTRRRIKVLLKKRRRRRKRRTQ
ncbi:MAG: PASTA domain-containing protein [Phycisphaerales bacterium]|nr:MAG: PASTA domain-containing protein [Phycisphaerales bacterium]